LGRPFSLTSPAFNPTFQTPVHAAAGGGEKFFPHFLEFLWNNSNKEYCADCN
jgi:hypothetical protein